MGESQCTHCGHITTGFEQQEFEHAQACAAAQAATIARLEAENAQMWSRISMISAECRLSLDARSQAAEFYLANVAAMADGALASLASDEAKT